MAEPTEEEQQAMREYLAELERKNNEEMQQKGIVNPYEQQ